ncbi:MAG: pyridoxal phosphate-dependent aminotransferase [Candidatus Dormibacteria bacterium]
MPSDSRSTTSLSRRVRAISESATLAMDRRAKELTAAGEQVISFAAGEPDFATPEVAVAAAERACRDIRAHHYTPAAGLPELREAVAVKTRRDAGVPVTAANVMITSGTKQAVAHAFTLLLDPGDEVLIPAPYWVTFPEAVTLAGGVPVPVFGDETTNFKLSVADLERCTTERTKALLFVSPSNPTGAVYGLERMREIGEWAAGRGLWVVCDEIYDQFTYSGAVFHSLPAVVPELQARSICLNGVAKAYAMTGWRVGWMVAPAEVITAAINLQSHVCGNISNVSQLAAVAALDAGLEPVQRMRAVFAERRERIVARLSNLPGFECLPPEGAFYAFPSVRGLVGHRVAGRVVQGSADLANILLDEAKVAVVPGDAFGAPGYLRFSYALSEEELEVGLDRLESLLA